jgi:FNIP Repeat
MCTLSPHMAIVHSPTSIPSKATQLILVMSHKYQYDAFPPFFPATLTRITLQNSTPAALPHTHSPFETKVEFNLPVHSLPATLTHFTTGDTFNMPLNKLPTTLTHLTTGEVFNQPINALPNSLTHLTTGNLFNQPVDTLPPTLTCQNWNYVRPAS